jgi:hypothetical protein
MPVEAPEGTAALGRIRLHTRTLPLNQMMMKLPTNLKIPFSVVRSTSTVGLPRES